MELMIDLETMGNGPTACVLSLGAVLFDENGVDDAVFYGQCDLVDSAKYGKIDASTVKWWLQQEEKARQELVHNVLSLPAMLSAFVEFLDQSPKINGVWGFGATFDNVILRSAFNATGIPCPWHFRQDRCFRTLAAINPHIEWAPRVGTHHNAADDAKTQALTAVKMLWPSLPQNHNPQC